MPRAPAVSLLIVLLITTSSEWREGACASEARPLVLDGATLIDVSDWGHAELDIENSRIVIDGEQIIAVGRADEVAVPAGARILDVAGFAVPGLIDGFAALNNQAYANAYLHEGVTSIIGVASARRGELHLEADPSPHVYRLDAVGRERKPLEEHLADLERLHAGGVRIALLMYQLTPDQVEALVARARELGMGTIGELGLTSYAEGARAGLDAFVHTTRYSLDMAPEPMRRAVAAQPFSDDLDSPTWRYYFWLIGLTEDDRHIAAPARRLAQGGPALMPTAALLYLDQSWAENPWREPIAALLDPHDIDNPADRESGRHTYPPERAEAYAALARAEIRLERAYYGTGARYLAGSGTDVWGTMPGISLHQELEVLVRAFGLTPREALAAASANIARAFRLDGVGEIAVGARADVLVVNADPRTDVRHLKQIHTLVQAGRVIDREALRGGAAR